MESSAHAPQPDEHSQRPSALDVIIECDFNDPDAACKLLLDAAHRMRESSWRNGCCVHLPSRGQLLATGDLHDNLDHLQRIVHLAELDAAQDHHLILHELIHGDKLINGMDFSYRMLLRIAQLVVQYPGQVHPLLANHELSQLMRRPISKGGGNSLEQFNDALDYVFRDEADRVSEAIDAFLYAMPLALRTDNGILCAHSLPNVQLADRFDPAVLERELQRDDYQAPQGDAYLMVWGRNFTQEHIDYLAEQWNVKMFVLGHQHVEGGVEICFDRVLLLNSDHSSAAVAKIDLTTIPDATRIASTAIYLATVTVQRSSAS